jgi:hypothetical protein
MAVVSKPFIVSTDANYLVASVSLAIGSFEEYISAVLTLYFVSSSQPHCGRKEPAA